MSQKLKLNFFSVKKMLKVNKMGESRSILVQAVINLLLTCIVALPGIDSITLFTYKFEIKSLFIASK